MGDQRICLFHVSPQYSAFSTRCPFKKMSSETLILNRKETNFFLPQTKPQKSSVVISNVPQLIVSGFFSFFGWSCLPDLFDTLKDESDSLGGCCRSYQADTPLEITVAEPLQTAQTGYLYAHTRWCNHLSYLFNLFEPLFASLWSSILVTYGILFLLFFLFLPPTLSFHLYCS